MEVKNVEILLIDVMFYIADFQKLVGPIWCATKKFKTNIIWNGG